jgi:alkylhydroperoxidase family enzyme
MGLVKELSEDEGGVKHSALLARFCDAVAGKDAAAMAEIRKKVLSSMGPNQLVDAVGVSAMFHMMNRVANATGTPLDTVMREAAPKVEESIGAVGFLSKEVTSPEGPA